MSERLSPGPLGARIRALRQARGLTLPELARRVGYGKGSLSEVERDRKRPGVDVLALLARELGVSMDTLYWGEDAVR